MSFQLEALYRDHLELAYTSIDRIYIKGFVPIIQSCGGFRTWAERLRPDKPVTQKWIRSWASKFHNNVRKFASQSSVPIVQADKGQRKHELAEQYREKFNQQQGVYLILISREHARVFVSAEPKQSTQSNHRNLRRKTAFVTYYYFYILDPHWGPLCVTICSHPPFNVRVILNAHHWMESEARSHKLSFHKRENAFHTVDLPEKLQQIANNLSQRHIRQVADRWTYRVLPILTYKERHDTCFHYQWSVAQMEVCHNLVFYASYPLAELFQRHIDLNRRFLSPHAIATVFGNKRAHGRQNSNLSIYQTYATQTIVRIKHHNSIIKQYDKHDRILRTECVCNDPRRFGIGRLLTNFGSLRAVMTETLSRFQQLLHGVLDSTLNRGELAALAQTSELGLSRVPGIRLDNERLMTVLQLLGRIATDPRGFSSAHLRQLYSARTGNPYSSSQASYDLRKLRAKHIITQVPKTRRYVLTPQGAQLAALLSKLYFMLLTPTVAAVNTPSSAQAPSTTTRRIPMGRPPTNKIPPDTLRTLLAKHAGNVAAVARDTNTDNQRIYRQARQAGIDIDYYRNPVVRPAVEEVYEQINEIIDTLMKTLAIRPAV